MKEKILLIVINVLLFVNCCIRAEDVVPYAEQAYVEMWTNLNGSSVQNLTTTENYLRSPNKSFFVDKLDIRPNGSKYGIRVRGCITPKETKEYTFWLSTDNGGELWLSSDDSSENLKKIAYQLYCSSIGQWDKYPTQKSETVVLEAGKSYYFEAFQKEHSGGDHLQVAWSYDGGSPEIIQGDVLGLFNKNDTQPPAKPENIIVYSLSENVNAMTWSKTTDNIAVFEYRIYKNGEYIKSVKTNFYSFASIEDSGVPDKYSVSAVDLLGNESDVSVAVSQADNALSSVDADNVNGLLGYYYNSLDCFMPSLVRLDANIDFYWSSGSPGQGINKDFFSVLWEGEVEPRYSEEYTFYAFADDGVRVWVNNELIIERWGYAPDELVSKSIILEAGKKYDIRIQHCERVGGACCKLSWASKSQTKEVLPSSCLYPKSLKNGSDVANTWTGFGDNNLYSNPLNWSKGVVPGENAIICFLPEYNNSCHIDSDISVKSMVVCSGYDASITSDNHTVNLTGDGMIK